MTAEKMNATLEGYTYDKCADDEQYGTAMLFTSDDVGPGKKVVVNEDGELVVIDQ